MLCLSLGIFFPACQENEETLPPHAEQVRKVLYSKDSLRAVELLEEVENDSLSTLPK
ncbi:MAG: hypothetical protein AAFP02_04705 [Bacteroidota bacterium]